MASTKSTAPIDWWLFTIAVMRMDPVPALLGSTLLPAIAACERFSDLHTLQRQLVAVLGCEHMQHFPQRSSYTTSLLKAVVAGCEAAARRIERQSATATTADEEEDTEAVIEDLLDLYLESTMGGGAKGGFGGGSEGIDKNEATTFYTALLASPFEAATSSAVSVTDAAGSSGEVAAEAVVAFLSDKATMGRFVPMRVTSAFVNVGLAVWPAAHITIDLIATLAEMSGGESTVSKWFPTAPSAMVDKLIAVAGKALEGTATGLGGSDAKIKANGLRILELGAGVGLTPTVLHKRYAYSTSSGSPTPAMTLCVTDYQPNILDNCAHNMVVNGCSYAHYKDSEAYAAGEAKEEVSTTSAASSSSNIYTHVAPLDWNERSATRQIVATLQPHLAIAADCIYDRCVLDGLSETLKDSMMGTADDEGCVGIIIQTHRNDATQTELHDKLHAFADVYSFHYNSAAHTLVPLAPNAEGIAKGHNAAGWAAGSVESDGTTTAHPIDLLKCGDWRVEMSDIMYVHFLWLKA